MKINCLLIDDEPLAMDVLASYIKRIDGLELAGRCDNAIQAFEKIQTTPVDLLFLDIQMPKLNGIEFLQTLKDAPKVIFTTAYRDYAIDAFEVDAIDYLLKPISFSRFLRAVSKVYQILQSPNNLLQNHPFAGSLSHSLDNPTNLSAMEFIYVKADKKMVKIRLNDIFYIESLKDYVIIHTPKKRIITKQKISYLEQKLPEDRFLRIHRSFIISLHKIEAFSPTSIDINNIELPIGRSYKREVSKVLGG